MATVVSELLVKLRADPTQLKGGLAAANAQMAATTATSGKMSKALKVGVKGGALAAGAAVIGLGAASLSAGAKFEKSMNRVKALSGATGKDFESLKDQAKELGRTTQFSASQSADAMGFLAMAGFKTNEILKVMPGTLDLAAAGQTDLAETADIASNVLTGFGIEAGKMNDVSDKLAKTFSTTNTDLRMLGESFKYAGPVAKSAGVSFDETAAAIGLMGNAGIQGSMAGTALRGAISRILSPSKKAAKAMNRLGLDMATADGKVKPLVDIIGQLEKSGATTADMMDIFGLRAGPAFASLVQQGSDALREQTKLTRDAGGTAQQIADTQMEGLSGAMKRLQSAWEGFLISIAETGLLEGATVLVEKAAEGVSMLTAAISGGGGANDSVNEFAKSMKPLSNAMADLVRVGTKLWNEFGDEVTMVVELVGRELGRIVVILSNVIRLVAALIEGDWSEAWKALKTIALTFFQGIIDKIRTLGTILVGIVFGIGRDIATRLMAGLRTLGTKVRDYLHGRIVSPWVEFYEPVYNNAVKVGTKILNGIKTLGTKVKDFLWGGLISIWPEMLTSVYNNAEAFARKIRSGIGSGLKGLNDWAGGKIASFVSVFIRGVNKLIGIVNKVIPGGDPIKSLKEVRFSEGQFVAAAKGMIATGPVMGVFGEDGDEALIPMSKKHAGTAIPLLDKAAAAHNMGLFPLHRFGEGGWVTGRASAYSPNDAGSRMANGEPFGWNTNSVAWPLRHGQHPGILGTPIQVRYGSQTIQSQIKDLGGIPHADIDLGPAVWRSFIGGTDPFAWGLRDVQYKLGGKGGALQLDNVLGGIGNVLGGILPDLPEIKAKWEFMGKNLIAGFAEMIRNGLLSYMRSAIPSPFGQGTGGPGGLVTAAGGGGSGWVFPVGVQRIGGGPGQGTHSYSSPPNNWQSDQAWDLMGNEGTPVFAAAAGRIGRVNNYINPEGRFWGGSLYQDVAGGQLWYKHLRNIFVSSGQSVTAGQILGLLGGTGVLNGGPHLHLGANPVGLLSNIPGLDEGGRVTQGGIARVHPGDVYNPHPVHVQITVMPGTGMTRAQADVLARQLQPALDRTVRARI